MSSTVEVIRDLADRMKRRRIEHELTQRELASRSNVSYGSLRLFERSGKISLESLVKIAFALEAEAEFERLFPGRPPQNIDDVIDRPLKQRVRRQSDNGRPAARQYAINECYAKTMKAPSVLRTANFPAVPCARPRQRYWPEIALARPAPIPRAPP